MKQTGRDRELNNERVYNMAFSSVYPLLLAKVERKGRSKAELDEVIFWLTGYDGDGLEGQLAKNASYRDFFAEAPALNPKARLITGLICGYRVEEITDALMQKVRWLDKLVDELAKGRKMEKILRQ